MSIEKMSSSVKEVLEPKKQTHSCFADYVVDVPEIIVNPKKFTNYKRLQLLGSGSYSKCYEVQRKLSAEHYACKVLSMVMVQDVHLKRLVRNEILIHCKLRHDHVVQFIESFNDAKHIYMIQSLCLNHSLRELLRHRGAVSIDECRYFMNQILKGVDYIHKSGIIHRDLKLSNVLMDERMQMKIGDFGLAIEFDSPHLKSKSLCGTTNYLAPEVVDRKGFAFGSDVWACGIIAYVLLYGYTPFEQQDALETYKRISNCDYYLPTDLSNDAKQFFESLLEKVLARRPTAEACLQLPFFTNYNIPSELSDEIFTREHVLDQLISKETSLNLDVMSGMTSECEQIEYPELRVLAQPQIVDSAETTRIAQALHLVHERFNNICRLYEPEDDFNFGDVTEFADTEPNYWIGKWFLDYVDGFVYQLSDKCVGMLFNEGLILLQTPGKEYLFLEPGNDRFHSINKFPLRPNLEEALQNFRKKKQELSAAGHFEAETPFNRLKMPPYLVTWFQTTEAMVMLLSNQTLQINFVKSHKKMLICTRNETVTFVTGKITRANFKTVSFATLAMHKRSEENFEMLKYATAAIKRMAKSIVEEAFQP